MPLIVYNITGAPITLSVVGRVIPASISPPIHGTGVDLTSELRPDLAVDPAKGHAGGLGAADYVAIAAQTGVVFEWTSNSEYITGLTILNSDGTISLVGLVDVYVDSILGNDNNPGTISAPLATIGAIYTKYPLFLLNDARVHIHLVGDATGVRVYEAKSLWVNGAEVFDSGYAYLGPEMNRAVPTTGPATAVPDVVPAVETLYKTAINFTAAAPGWTVNDLRGWFLRVTRAGRLVFYETPIASNTANQITIDLAGVAATVLQSDTYEIVRPAVKITSSAQYGILPITGYSGANIAGMAANIIQGGLNADAALPFTRIQFGDEVLTALVVVNGTTGVGFDRCYLYGDQSFTHCQVGFASTSINSSAAAGGNGTTQFVHASGMTVGPIGDPLLPLVWFGLQSVYNSLVLGWGYFGVGLGPGTFRADAPVSVYAAHFVASGGIWAHGVGSVFDSSSFSAPVQGSGNAGSGIKCSFGGLTMVGTGSLTTLTGTGGSLVVGGRAAVAYGTGAGQFEEAVGINGNLLETNNPALLLPGFSRITTGGV